MKKRYWFLLAGGYAAAMIGFFIYEYAESRRSEVEVIPSVYTATSSTGSEPRLTTASAARTTQTTAVTTTATSGSTTSSTPQTSTAQTTQQTTTTTASTTTTATSTTTATTTETTTATTISYPLDLNRATREQLCTLPGIGETLAQAIIDKRERIGGFINRKQLLEIPGIGDSIYDEIRWLLYIDNEQPLTDPVPVTPNSPADPGTLVINLNTATESDLLRLPGCNEQIAGEILWLRGEIGIFHNPAELKNLQLAQEHTVPNIDSLYEQWKDYLFVDDNGAKQIP